MFPTISALLAAGADPRISYGGVTALSIATPLQLLNVISLLNGTNSMWSVIAVANTSSVANTIAALGTNNIGIDIRGPNGNDLN